MATEVFRKRLLIPSTSNPELEVRLTGEMELVVLTGVTNFDTVNTTLNKIRSAFCFTFGKGTVPTGAAPFAAAVMADPVNTPQTVTVVSPGGGATTSTAILFIGN